MSRRLGLLLALALVLRLAFFTGLRGSDDLEYARLAKAHAEGAPLIPPGTLPFQVGTLRPAFTEGISLAVRAFGFSEASLMLYPTLCSLALVALTYAAARLWIGEGAALASGLLAAALPGLVLSSSSLYPDVPMALWVFASLVLLWGALEWGRWARGAALGAGLAFSLAVHHKETALMSLPVLLLLGLTQGRRHLAAWTLTALALGLASGWGGYLPHKLTANLRNIAHNQSTLDPSVIVPYLNNAMGTTSTLAGRLLLDFSRPLLDPLRPGLFSLWAGVAWLAAGGVWLGFRQRSKPLLACALWAVLAFLALDAFGIPGRGYFPMHPVSPRYLAFVMPPLVLLAGAFSAWAWSRTGRLRWAAALSAAMILLAFNLAAAAPNRPYGKALRVSLDVLGQEGSAEVWTDRRTAEGLGLFLGKPRIRVFPGDDPAPASGLVVVNGPVLGYLAREYRDPVPPWVLDPPPGWTRLADEAVEGLLPRKGGDPLRRVSVYRIGTGGMPGLLAAAAPPVSSGITPRQRTVVTLMGLGLIVFIFELVRRRRLREEYSWLWMLSGTVILLFALYDPALLWITGLIGAGLPTTTLFFFGLFFLILISIHYAVKISTLTTQQKNLMQELALLKEQMERGKGP